MLVIAKRKMHFHRAEIIDDPTTKQKVRRIHESHIVKFLPTEIQVAPDWIREDGLFDLAVQDGDLIVLDGDGGIAVAGATVAVMGWNAGKVN